ncbi:eukaryotic translation initiation factor 2C-like protein [Leptotrombidium deliense]|uniref:Eukaryotic translation initiation factor 2C-like protein n=1 Tax=Leptotrombidium deliense TaxID=299467 RepID=A0A443SKH3_9ACAR|nr:eukaryotic translation initiation factor 2C-like protein [Leptotrombidium deliense]
MDDFKNSGQNGCQSFNSVSSDQQPVSSNYRHKYSGRADGESNWRDRRPVNNGNSDRGYTRENNWRDRRANNSNGDRGYTRGRQTAQRWPEFGETAERKVVSVCEDNIALLKLLKQMNIKRELKFADKPTPGNAGRDILLLANYFKLKLDFDDTLLVHHYDVTFEKMQDSLTNCDVASGDVTQGPKGQSQKLEKQFSGRIIEKMLSENCGKDQIFNGVIPVYDFEKNLYTKKQLNSSNEAIRIEVKVKEFEQQEEDVYIVSLQHVTKVELNPKTHIFSFEAMQFIDIALLYGPSRDRIVIGSEIFCRSPENRVSIADDNKEVVTGFFQAVRNSEAGLVLNVDRATSLFHTSGPSCPLLPEQRVTSGLSHELQSKVVKETTRQRPNERFFEISDSVEKFILRDGKQFMNEFGISLNKNLVKFCARVIPAPKLKFGDNFVTEELSEGDWDLLKPERKQCQYGVVINKWILVDLSVNNNWLPDSFIAEFQKTLLNTAKQMGITMYPSISGDWSQHNFTNIDNLRECVFEEAVKQIPNLQLILFIIPDGSSCYHSLKILADLEFGVVTQCVNKKHFRESGEKMLHIPYVSNVLLKINAKMNGLNWLLDVKWSNNKNIMFVGVEVMELSPGINIVSVVGSYDYTFARYDTVFNVQKEMKYQEVDLKSAIQKLLESYKMHNKSLPNGIIIYRDGVSESQFNQVMVHEVSKVVDLFETLKIKPKVTYVVVQKRHTTRFLTVNRDEATRSLNIPVGTVVDSVVTDASKFDFFICSQRGIMSTSIPSRYWVLFDESNFTADQIQEITFNMCFLYPCSTRSVSVPSPVELAHLSAERAKSHLEKLFEGAEFDLKDLTDADFDKLNESVKMNEKLSQRLFYL